MGEHENALKLLYQLNYEQPENAPINRALAWALLSNRQAEQAERIYQKLIAAEQVDLEDYLNYGYCCWMLGRIDEAVHYLKQYIASLEHSSSFSFDNNLLTAYNVGQTQVKLMTALIY